ncbi:MAG: alpha/beta fold hydrolase [Planctomycetales bacterium]|nr:alpha/beta fold hydrolase [Planctomycetales bacterium]
MGTAIVAAPNVAKPQLLTAPAEPPWTEQMLGVDEFFRVPVGPVEASLAVYVIEPEGEDQISPRGTIIVLHGMGARSAWMHGTATNLARHGYRAVLVDLRGHGASSGKLLTYGLQESRDISQVIDALAERRLLSGRLGVYGISYGAATAIHLAAVDRRVEAVVAVAPFSDMRGEVAHYLRTIGLPGVGLLLTDEQIQAAVDEAGELGRFSPDMADAGLAIRYTGAPVLLLHGTADMIIPLEHSERLHEAAPQHSDFQPLRGYGHLTVWLDPLHTVRRRSVAWFDRYLTDESPVVEPPAMEQRRLNDAELSFGRAPGGR